MCASKLFRVGMLAGFAVLFGTLGFARAETVSAPMRPDWLQSSEVSTLRVSDLPDNVPIETLGYSCQGRQPQSGIANGWCIMQTPVGKVANQVLLDGPKGAYSLDYFYGFMGPSIPGHPEKVLTYYSPSSGGWVMQVSTYDANKLVYHEQSTPGLATKKWYDYRPVSPVSLLGSDGQTVKVNAKSLAFSENGNWMVVGLSAGGFMLYDTATFTGRAVSVESVMNVTGSDFAGANLAVSNDGKYIAVNVNLGTPTQPVPTLRVYDTTTCLDQYKYLLLGQRDKSNACEFRDVWSDTFRSASGSQAAKTSAVGAEYPYHLRFMASNSLTFDAVYARTSSTAFKAARYAVTVGTEAAPPMSLLGMGDSYISGEGAFNYRSPTDTRGNKCHNSWSSYPYQQGYRYYPWAASVACSGAVMYDVGYDFEDYIGQGRVKPQLPWINRSPSFKDTVSRNFVPGYQGQVNFAKELHPRAVLLSVGGNDINFANIVTGCVSNTQEGSCYPYYKERKELMMDIASKYADLKLTYETVKRESKGRVYVMGYPEIAKPGGDCGANVHLDATEVQFSSDLVKFLNKVISNAASDAGVFYVNNEKALYGNRLCEVGPNNLQAVNGLTYGQEGGFWFVHLVGNESFHPNALGHKILGQKAAALTGNFTATMPSPTNLGAPKISDSDPLLAGRKPSTANYNRIIWKGVSSTPSALKRGGKYIFDATKVPFRAFTHTMVVLHSDPVTLYEGTQGVGDSSIEVTIPESVPTGFHTLHVYGMGEDGQPLDVAEVVYVAASETDYDGDGAPNEQSPCKIVPASGVDTDGDSVDDACDAQLFESGTASDPDLITPQTSEPVDVNLFDAPSNEETSSGSLLRYIPPAPPTPPAPETPPQPTPGEPTEPLPHDQSMPIVATTHPASGTSFASATQPVTAAVHITTTTTVVVSDIFTDEMPQLPVQSAVLAAESKQPSSHLNKRVATTTKPESSKKVRVTLLLTALCGSVLLLVRRRSRAKDVR